MNYEHLVDPGRCYAACKLETFHLGLILSCRTGTGRMRHHLDSAGLPLEIAMIAARCGRKDIRAVGL
jgi:hypothetical protein